MRTRSTLTLRRITALFLFVLTSACTLPSFAQTGLIVPDGDIRGRITVSQAQRDAWVRELVDAESAHLSSLLLAMPPSCSASIISQVECGQAAFATRDYAAAVDSLSAAATVQTENVLLQYYLALSYAVVQNYAMADRAAAHILERMPRSPYGLYARAIVNLGTGSDIAAIEHCNRSIALGDSNQLAYRIRGFAYRGLGRLNDSQQEFFRSTQLSVSLASRLGTVKGSAIRSVGAATPVGGVVDGEVPSASASLVSLWPRTATPYVPATATPTAMELGVKFRVDVPGRVVGVRFYKGPANSGTHTGSLWSGTGDLLATGTFTQETDIGWQELRFTSPVQISSGKTYVASYHTQMAGFAYDPMRFRSAGLNSGPLHALQSGVDGWNGLYAFGPSGFPQHGYNDSNFGVDVLFEPASTTGVYELQFAPNPPMSLILTLNGLVLRQGSDYTLSGTRVTMNTSVMVDPSESDVVQAWYRY